MGVGLMKSKTTRPSHRLSMFVVLAAAAAAVSAALVWSGSSAVATVVAGVASTAPGQVTQTSQGQDATSALAPSQQAALSHQVHAPGAATARPIQETPSGMAGPKGAEDRPEVSLEEAGRAAVGGAVHSGTDRSRNLSKVGKVTPSELLGATASLGGCLLAYGDSGQCLPSVPPSLAQHLQEMKDAGLDPASMPHAWTCDEVRKYFKSGISVRQAGVDPQKLDANADGIACGRAD